MGKFNYQYLLPIFLALIATATLVTIIVLNNG
jgi:hypothetical protein